MHRPDICRWLPREPALQMAALRARAARPNPRLAGSDGAKDEKSTYGSPQKASQGLQEIDDRVDFLLRQNAIAPEWRHHCQRVARGLVGQNGDEFVAVGVFA